MNTKRPRDALAPARRAWKQAYFRGEMKWLDNCNFISAACFEPPAAPTYHHAWDRVAVPTASSSPKHQMIYKRVSVKPPADKKYIAVVAELESQGFGERKRSKTEDYIAPYGDADFIPEDVIGTAGKDLVAAARHDVKSAYRAIWKDNQDLPVLRSDSKRSYHDPAPLVWTPRKRHWTRWPVNPPEANAPMIAEMQPLIKFELRVDQIDEQAFWDQYNAQKQEHPDMPQTPALAQGPEEPVQQLPLHRGSLRRTTRPSLSTIAEESMEASDYASLTPVQKRRVFITPSKSWVSIAANCETPNQVTAPPLVQSIITGTLCQIKSATRNQSEKLSALDTTEESPTKAASKTVKMVGGVEVTNLRGHFRCPSVSTESTVSCATDVDQRDNFRVPSLSAIEASTNHSQVTLFDQPVPDMLMEPEHETKRRVSLNNARRSDRNSDAKTIKRVSNWIAGTTATSRRHSDVVQLLREPQRNNRRHTLDVDVASNPDIFSQKLDQVGEKMSKWRQPPTDKDQVYSVYEGEPFTQQQHQPSAQKTAVRKKHTLMDFDLNSIKLAEIKIAGAYKKALIGDGVIPPEEHEFKPNVITNIFAPYTNHEDIFITMPDTGPHINGKHNSVVSEESEVNELVVTNATIKLGMDNSTDAQAQAELNEVQEQQQGVDSTDRAEEHIAHCEIQTHTYSEAQTVPRSKQGSLVDSEDRITAQNNKVPDTKPRELPYERTNETSTILNENETTDDDSALSFLHNFVARAQNNKGSKVPESEASLSSASPGVPEDGLSGSMSSVNSNAGSPMAKQDKKEKKEAAESPRKPLGEKDSNKSPSPSKKRKLQSLKDVFVREKKSRGRLETPDLDDIEEPKPKKRRRRMESDSNEIFNPEMSVTQDLTQKTSGTSSASRRSTRIAKTAKPAASFQFPKTPGILQDMPAVSTSGITHANIQQKADRDLAQRTRINTTRNKGGALSVAVSLAAMAAVAGTVFGDTPTPEDTMSSKKAAPGRRKTVCWASVLTRVQGEEEGEGRAVVAAEEGEEEEAQQQQQRLTQKEETMVEEEETLPSPPQMRSVGLDADMPGTPVVGSTAASTSADIANSTNNGGASPSPRPAVRRSSRLPKTAARVAPPTATPATPKKKSSHPGTPRVTKSRAGAGVSESTRTRLGMVGSGTPAPKRGARRGEERRR